MQHEGRWWFELKDDLQDHDIITALVHICKWPFVVSNVDQTSQFQAFTM